MIINPVTVKFSRHHLEAARRVIELAIASRATGRVRREALEGAIYAIDEAFKVDLFVRMLKERAAKGEPA